MKRGAGRRRAGAALLALLLAGCGDESAGSPPAATPLPAPPPCRFDDATEASGLRFRHETGAAGRKYLPETMGSGAAFLDADQDGRLDLFFVNGGPLPEPAPAPPGAANARCALFRGLGDGTFEDVSASSGAAIALYGMGASAGDVDGDGDEDLYVTALGDNVLLVNEGGRFDDGTARAGVAGGRWTDADGAAHPEWSTSAAFADLDSDGDLDLFVVNYVAWTPETEIFTTIDGITKAFTTPDRYRGLPCRLFENRGDGTFDDRSAAAGLLDHLGKGLGVAFFDFDDDGRLDVFVANDTRPNFLFMNRGGLRFEEVGFDAGCAYDEDGRARAGMGVDVAVLDGAPSVAIGNFSREPISLYRWRREGGFQPSAADAGLAAATHAPLTFGLLFADLDLDGREDLVLANGHVEPDIARFLPGETHAQPMQLFRGEAGGRFARWGEDAPALALPRVARGLLAGDVDQDGDPDLVVTTNGGSPALLLNRARETAQPPCLLVRLRGRPGNPLGVGALVTFEQAGRAQRRILQPGGSYLSRSEPVLRFGMGAGAAAGTLTIRWPSGRTSRADVPAGGGTVEIEEPR